VLGRAKEQQEQLPCEGGQAGAKGDHSTGNALTGQGTVLCGQGVQHPSTVLDKAR